MADLAPLDRSLVWRVQMEYLEMPGLRLTAIQARRLWNIDQHSCDEILATLVHERFLSKSLDGSYLRRSSVR